MEDFRTKGEALKKEFESELKDIEDELNKLGEDETKEYENIMRQFEEYISKTYTEITYMSPDKDIQLMQGSERIKAIEDYVYDVLGLDKETYNNGLGGQFLKGIIDEIIIGNAQLLNDIYESNGAVLLDMVEFLLSWEGLKEIAIQLGISIGDLFVGNAYEKGRSFGQLGLVTTGGGLMISGGKKLFQITKGQLLNAKTLGGAGLIALEGLKGLENLSESVRNQMVKFFGSIGKLEKLFAKSRIVKGGMKEALSMFESALSINQKLLKGEDYIYMSSMSTYLLLKEYNVTPGDLDIALNPRNMGKFVDNFLSQHSKFDNLKEVEFLEFVKGGKPQPIDINDVGKIKQVAEDGRLNISYRIFDGKNPEGIEVELFPETNGKGLTNLGYMDKTKVNHKYNSKDHGVLDIYTLDNKGTAEGYVLNYLSEYGNNAIDKIGQEGLKIKDGKRINNMYLLLKDAGIIDSPDGLLDFIDDTIRKYENLPQKGPYVEQALDIRKVKEGREILGDRIKEFKRDLHLNGKSGVNDIGELIDYDIFKKTIEKKRERCNELFLRLKGGDKSVVVELNNNLNKLRNYVEDVKKTINNKDGFPQYYEYKNTVKYIKGVENTINDLINK